MIRKRALRIAIILFAVGSWGIAIGASTNTPFVLYLAIINIVLGLFFLRAYRKGSSKS